jgi:hypothetical protein
MPDEEENNFWEDFDDDDDDGFDFDPDDFDKEDFDKHRDLPVFKKAMQIAELTRAVVDTFDREKDVLNMRESMMEHAYILGAKIAGAEGADLYSIRMENAVLIKINARELLASTSWCKEENLCDRDYLQLLRNEIEEFRKLFVDWVENFDKTNDIEDDWGIKF